MKRFIVSTAITLIGVVMGSVAQADDTGHLGWVAGLNFSFGGDEVARVYFADQSEQSVKAGQGITFFAGGHYRPAQSRFDYSATLGYKYVGTKASNADINLSRTVFELQVSYAFNDAFWASAGPVWHNSVKFHGDGLGPNVSFDGATGLTAKLGWRMVALTMTNMDYTDQFGNDYSANNFGIDLVAKF